MSRPLLHAVRQAAPDAEIRGAGPKSLLELLALDAVLDDARAPGRPDVVLVLPPSFSSAWFAFRTGAKIRIGFRGQARSLLLTDALQRPARGAMHLSEEYLMLAARIGAKPVPLPPLEAPPESVRMRAARQHTLGLGERPWVVLAPGAIYGPTKRWPLERFIEVGRHYLARGCDVVACGAASDRDVADRLASALGDGSRSLAGETTVGEQLAWCAGARVNVSNDSGLAHLAAATGAPTVAIFGATSSAWTAPLGPRVAIAQRAPVCSPCFQRTCRIGVVCLDRVRVETVLQAADAAERAWVAA